MRDERYWEEEGWPVLCQQTITLCLRHDDALFDRAATDRHGWDTQVERFVERIISALGRRASDDKQGPWRVALSFFGDTAALKHRLLNDPGLRPDSDSDVAPRQALRRKLRDFLADMRRQQRPHRANVWARLDYISGLVLEASKETPTPQRCGSTHFLAVHNYIREHYPNDHNLPRRLEAVEAYFLEFCPDCRDRFVDHEIVSLTPGDILALLNEIEIDLATMLDTCLEGLSQEQRTLYDSISAVFQIGDVIPLSQAAFRQQQGLSRRQLEQRQQQGLQWLRHCIEQQVSKGDSLWSS